MIGPRVADRVEEAGAAVDMAPPLGMTALGIGAHIEKGVPVIVAQIRRQRCPIDLRLAAVPELQLRPFTALWAVDDEQMRTHHCDTPAAAPPTTLSPYRTRPDP